jgi:hypothetical protein
MPELGDARYGDGGLIAAMKNNQDGGEAILDAFRSLGAEYVISSPASEWAPVWEAFARQELEKKPGPRYLDVGHETAAVGGPPPRTISFMASISQPAGARALRRAVRHALPVCFRAHGTRTRDRRVRECRA